MAINIGTPALASLQKGALDPAAIKFYQAIQARLKGLPTGALSPQAVHFYQGLGAQPAHVDPYGQQAQNYYKMLEARAGTLPPQQEVQLQQGMSNANLQYGQQLAQNNYQRGQTDQQYGDQLANLQRAIEQRRTIMPYGYNARGLLGSGIWRQGLQDFSTGNALQYGQLSRQRAGALGGFTLAQQQLEQQRNAQLANLKQQKAAALQQQGLGLQGYSG